MTKSLSGIGSIGASKARSNLYTNMHLGRSDLYTLSVLLNYWSLFIRLLLTDKQVSMYLRYKPKVRFKHFKTINQNILIQLVFYEGKGVKLDKYQLIYFSVSNT